MRCTTRTGKMCSSPLSEWSSLLAPSVWILSSCLAGRILMRSVSNILSTFASCSLMRMTTGVCASSTAACFACLSPPMILPIAASSEPSATFTRFDLNSSGEMFLYDKVIEYICIVMSMLIQRTDQEILMSFVASCIEDVADKLNLDYAEVYERMKVVGMIENYIIPHYDVLHTESRENVTAGMIDTLKRWEGQK